MLQSGAERTRTITRNENDASERGAEVEPGGVRAGVGGDFFEDGGGGGRRAPSPEAGGFGGIEYHPRDVEGAGLWVGGDGVGAEGVVAPIGELAERPGGGGTAGEIGDAVGGGECGRGELFGEERGEVARVEAIADLVAVATEADVAERALAEVGVQPVGEDALIGAAELAGPSEDAAAVDEDGEVERGAVFEGEGFAGEFGGAVEGDGGGGGKFLGDAGGADAAGETGRGGDGAEGVLVDFDGECGEGRDRVDAARGEQNKTGAVGLAELEHVDRAPEVVLDELAGTGLAIDASEDAGIGGGVDDPIDGGERLEVAGGAEVAVKEFDADFFEAVAVGLAAGADEIIEADEGVAGAGFGEGAREGAADKAAHTGDQNSHGWDGCEN